MFDVRVNPTDALTTNLIFNGQELEIPWNEHHTVSPGTVSPLPTIVRDLRGREHVVLISIFGDIVRVNQPDGDEVEEQAIGFHVADVDGVYADLDFLLVLTPSQPLRLKRLMNHRTTTVSVDFASFDMSFMVALPVWAVENEVSTMPENSATEEGAVFDLAEESHSLKLLETQAERLRLQISSKKQIIAYHLREQRNGATLEHLLEECDGLICAAKIIAQRICDKVATATKPSFSYANLDTKQLQHLITFSDESQKPQQASRNCTKSKTVSKLSAVSAEHSDKSQSATMPIS